MNIEKRLSFVFLTKTDFKLKQYNGEIDDYFIVLEGGEYQQSNFFLFYSFRGILLKFTIYKILTFFQKYIDCFSLEMEE